MLGESEICLVSVDKGSSSRRAERVQSGKEGSEGMRNGKRVESEFCFVISDMSRQTLLCRLWRGQVISVTSTNPLDIIKA